MEFHVSYLIVLSLLLGFYSSSVDSRKTKKFGLKHSTSEERLTHITDSLTLSLQYCKTKAFLLKSPRVSRHCIRRWNHVYRKSCKTSSRARFVTAQCARLKRKASRLKERLPRRLRSRTFTGNNVSVICGKSHINIRTHRCCNGSKYRRKTEGCCGDKIYRKATEDCCSEVYPYSKNSQNCCGGKVYFINSQECCGGTLFSNDSQECCGGTVYSKYSQDCCGGTLFSNDSLGCCDGTLYSNDSQECCGGTVYSKYSQECCGGTLYSNDSLGCCDGTVFNRSRQGCCNSDIFDIETEACCNLNVPQIDGRHNVLCCGNESIDSSFTFCFNGSVIPKDVLKQENKVLKTDILPSAEKSGSLDWLTVVIIAGILSVGGIVFLLVLVRGNVLSFKGKLTSNFLHYPLNSTETPPIMPHSSGSSGSNDCEDADLLESTCLSAECLTGLEIGDSGVDETTTSENIPSAPKAYSYTGMSNEQEGGQTDCECNGELNGDSADIVESKIDDIDPRFSTLRDGGQSSILSNGKEAVVSSNVCNTLPPLGKDDRQLDITEPSVKAKDSSMETSYVSVDSGTQTSEEKQLNIKNSLGKPFDAMFMFNAQNKTLQLNHSAVILTLSDEDTEEEKYCLASTFRNPYEVQAKLQLDSNNGIASPAVEYRFVNGVLKGLAKIAMPFVGDSGQLKVLKVTSDSGIKSVAVEKKIIKRKDDKSRGNDKEYYEIIGPGKVAIFVKSLSWIVCTCGERVGSFQLDAYVYGRLVAGPDPQNDREASISMYLVGPIHGIEDYKQLMEQNEFRGVFLMGQKLILPPEVSLADHIRVSLMVDPPNLGWEHKIKSDGTTIQPEEEDISMHSIIECNKVNRSGLPFAKKWYLRSTNVPGERLRCIVDAVHVSHSPGQQHTSSNSHCLETDLLYDDFDKKGKLIKEPNFVDRARFGANFQQPGGAGSHDRGARDNIYVDALHPQSFIQQPDSAAGNKEEGNGIRQPVQPENHPPQDGVLAIGGVGEVENNVRGEISHGRLVQSTD